MAFKRSLSDRRHEREDEYDERLEDVSRALGNLERPGGCFVAGSFSKFPLPAVQIRRPREPAEFVHLPFDEAAAKRVIAKCRLAPYGHRERTIVDTSVRNTWELNASELAITNPEWEPLIHGILSAIRAPLGIAEAAQIEAKLYKLLVYEKGGKFERHQDSEKEPGMFGTLVVVLPCEFTGGELHVQDPGKANRQPHIWSPGEMSPYDVKYAAFYGDCTHEVKPVTSGYRLCLTYNLVTSTVADVPRFAGTSQIESIVMQTLTAFFKDAQRLKRLRCGAGPEARGPPSFFSDRRLVYILDHEYSEYGLRFGYLKNKDHVVAKALAAFCEASKGELMLFLARLRYKRNIAETTVTLRSPWVKYGSTEPSNRPHVYVSPSSEVAPVGYLNRFTFKEFEPDFTGNEGSDQSQWYDTAALVIQDVELELDQLAEADGRDAVKTLKDLVTRESPQAVDFAHRMFDHSQHWTSTNPEFLECLAIIERLNELPLFVKLIKSAGWYFAFQPRLRQAVLHFGWDVCAETILRTAKDASMSARMNLVCSLLSGETDPARIVDSFSCLELRAVRYDSSTQRSYDYSKRSSPPNATELHRILDIARQLSEEKVIELIATDDDDLITKLIVPALESLHKSTRFGPVLTQHVTKLHDDLLAKLPAFRNTHFLKNQFKHACETCHAMQAFVSSETTDQIRVTATNAKHLKHIELHITRFNRYCRDKIIAAPQSQFVLQLTKQFGKNETLDAAQRAIKSLAKMIAPKPPKPTAKRRTPAPVSRPKAASATTTPLHQPAVQPPRPTAIAHPQRPRTMPQEVIEIEDSD